MKAAANDLMACAPDWARCGLYRTLFRLHLVEQGQSSRLLDALDPPPFPWTPGLSGWGVDKSLCVRAIGMGSGEGASLPQRGSRAKPARSWLKRSAAVRGQSPREVRVQGEETHGLWKTLHHDQALS